MENETAAQTAEAVPVPGDEGKVVGAVPETAQPAVQPPGQDVFSQTWTKDRIEKLKLVDVIGNGAGSSTIAFDSENLEPIPDILSPLTIIVSDGNPPLALLNINVAVGIGADGKVTKKAGQVLVPIYRLLMTSNPQAVKHNLKYKRMPDMGMSAHVRLIDNLPKVATELYVEYTARMAKRQAEAAASGAPVTPQDLAPAPVSPMPAGANMGGDSFTGQSPEGVTDIFSDAAAEATVPAEPTP